MAAHELLTNYANMPTSSDHQSSNVVLGTMTVEEITKKLNYILFVSASTKQTSRMVVKD